MAPGQTQRGYGPLSAMHSATPNAWNIRGHYRAHSTLRISAKPYAATPWSSRQIMKCILTLCAHAGTEEQQALAGESGHLIFVRSESAFSLPGLPLHNTARSIFEMASQIHVADTYRVMSIFRYLSQIFLKYVTVIYNMSIDRADKQLCDWGARL